MTHIFRLYKNKGSSARYILWNQWVFMELNYIICGDFNESFLVPGLPDKIVQFLEGLLDRQHNKEQPAYRLLY
jgi:hypothetical protein